MYTHNIEKLLTYADAIGIDIIVSDYVRDNSLILTEWEAGSRYNVGFQIRITTLDKALCEINRWYNDVYATGLRQA